MWYDIIINDESGFERNIYVVKRPDMPAPVKRYQVEKIPNLDGELYYDEGTFEDLVIDVELNYMCAADEWNEKFRECKKWILGAKTLQFSDDLMYFYKVKKVEIDINNRMSKKIGRFNVEFTVDPYCYLTIGNVESTLKMCEFNPYEIAHPIYLIKGEGMCTLSVNGKIMTANVGQNLTIDTERKLAYRADGTLMNTTVTGDYEDLYLVNGNNSIEISTNFELKIIPNWRVL